MAQLDVLISINWYSELVPDVILQLSKVLYMLVVELGYPLVFVGFFYNKSHRHLSSNTVRDNRTIK